MSTSRARLPKSFEVIELRRYTVKPEERASFGRAFETYFPEAFQQLGALIFGQFNERGDPSRFTWIRGYHDLPSRTAVCHAFYDGPLWREHAGTMNDRLVDHTDVLLLRPVAPAGELPVLPAVDAIAEGAVELGGAGARGVVAAHIFAVRPEAIGAAVAQAQRALAAQRDRPDIRPAGLLVSLDVPNDFPRLPVRSDGPFLVWLAIVPDDEALAAALGPRAGALAAALAETDALRAPPELVVLEPTPRSRLRWTAP